MIQSLTAMVVGVEHASQFTDGKARATLRVTESDAIYRNIRIPVDDLPQIGAKYTFELVGVELIEVTLPGNVERGLAAMADHRPDLASECKKILISGELSERDTA